MKNYSYSKVIRELAKPEIKKASGFAVTSKSLIGLSLIHASRYIDDKTANQILKKAKEILGEARYRAFSLLLTEETLSRNSKSIGFDPNISAFSMEVKNGRKKARK